MRRSYFADKEFGRIRLIAIIVSLVLHGIIFFGLIYQIHQHAALVAEEEMKFGSSGGGGGEGAEDDAIQFGPQGSTEQEHDAETKAEPQFTLLQIHVYDEIENAIPVPKKEEPKPTTTKKKRTVKPLLADNLPTRWIRRGTGPGSGGGAGGGSGGGIGRGQGYSIDWGGTGSRRLLSGKLPKYPEGTDKQMAVTLQFSVLPDGSVDAIMPSRKSDERLESAAISALRTWRFDPLPPQIDQKSQVGSVTFNFKLE